MLQAFGRKILRLHRDQDTVGGSQRVDGQHPQRRLAVDENVRIASPDGAQVLPQDGFTAHGVYQRHLHARQLDVGREDVHPLRVVQDPFTGMQRAVGEDARHCVGQGEGELVRLRMSETDGQAGLRICVDKQHFLSCLCQTDAQIGAGGGFSDAALLVSDGDDLSVHGFTSVL